MGKTNEKLYFLYIVGSALKGLKDAQSIVSISSGQRNLMKTYQNEANTGGITKIASKFLL